MILDEHKNCNKQRSNMHFMNKLYAVLKFSNMLHVTSIITTNINLTKYNYNLIRTNPCIY